MIIITFPQATFIRRLLNIFLCMSQIGSNAVYILFVAQNILPVTLKFSFVLNILLFCAQFILLPTKTIVPVLSEIFH